MIFKFLRAAFFEQNYRLGQTDYKTTEFEAVVTRLSNAVSQQEQKQSTGGVLQKNMFLKVSQNSQENTCARVSFLIKLQAWPATLLKRRQAQMLSCEFSEIFKNIFFTESQRTTASAGTELEIEMFIFSFLLTNHKMSQVFNN